MLKKAVDYGPMLKKAVDYGPMLNNFWDSALVSFHASQAQWHAPSWAMTSFCPPRLSGLHHIACGMVLMMCWWW
jgi:hypothetical protein